MCDNWLSSPPSLTLATTTETRTPFSFVASPPSFLNSQLSATQKRLMDDDFCNNDDDAVTGSGSATPSSPLGQAIDTSNCSMTEDEEEEAYSPQISFPEDDEDSDCEERPRLTVHEERRPAEVSPYFLLPVVQVEKEVAAPRRTTRPKKPKVTESPSLKRRTTPKKTLLNHKEKAREMMATLSNVIDPAKTSNPKRTGRPPLAKTFAGHHVPSAIEEGRSISPLSHPWCNFSRRGAL